MAWVYILQTEAGKYYIGSTSDLEVRLKHHFNGHTPSTKRLKATSLALAQEYTDLKIARAVEAKLKRLKRKDYIEKIIEDGYIRIVP